MAKTYNKMLIDVNEEIDGIITEVQADQNSRYLDIYLYNNGVPIDLTDHTVRIYMRRPKTNPLEEFFDDGEITEEVNGRCQFLLKTQALAKEGFLEAQITIWKGAEELLSTHMFKIKVVTNIMSDGSVEASNEYGALVVLFQNLYEAYDLMVTMVQSFGSAGETAQAVPATTFWQMLEAVYSVNADALANASVSEVLNRLGLAGDTGGTNTVGTVFAKLNALFSTSVIKRIQRFDVAGITNLSLKDADFDNAYYTDVTIAEVDVSKTMVIANARDQFEGSTTRMPCAKLLNSTTVRVYATRDTSYGGYITGMHVQVVEYR